MHCPRPMHSLFLRMEKPCSKYGYVLTALVPQQVFIFPCC